jgi:hypothetical protein
MIHGAGIGMIVGAAIQLGTLIIIDEKRIHSWGWFWNDQW